MDPLALTLGGYPDTSDPQPSSRSPLLTVLASDSNFPQVAKNIANVALKLSYGTDEEARHYPNDPGTS